jgi:5S rRNA maturation endonuclease (ribonuclease M5)
MAKSIRDYREMLSPEDIKRILKDNGVDEVRENSSMIVYPTVCHNVAHDHSSHKLYYYKKNNMFKCYTECNAVFDIFELLIKMKRVEGQDISLRKAIQLCGLDGNESIDENEYYGVREQLDYLYEINNNPEDEPTVLKILSKDIMNRYIFDLSYLTPWISEGITPETLVKYGIKFDTISNAIVMPYYTDTKDLVGVRGRFLSPDAKAKYMPMKYNGEYLAHPTSKTLYGLDINKAAIQRLQSIILFEGEKSVMKMDSMYGENNISVAVSGRNLSKDHISLLVKYGVQNIILAFDRDYKSHKEIEKEINEYTEIFKHAKNFFNISIVIDYDFVLEHKNAPVDQGRPVFEELMSKRVFL